MANGLTAIQIGNDVFPIDFSQHNHDNRYPIIYGDAEYSAVLKGEYQGYSNNAISKTSMAVGAATIAGLKGWYYSSIDFTNKKITLSDRPTYILIGETLINGGWNSGTPNIKVDDVISLVNDSKYDLCSKVTAINGNVITVDILPFTNLVKDNGAAAAVIAGQFSDGYSVYIPDRPDAGLIDFGGGAFSEGSLSKSTNIASHAEGLQTHAYGQYSHTEGRETKAGYAAHAEGLETEAKGLCSHAEGSGAQAIGDGSHAEGRSTQSNGKYSHAEGRSTKAIGTNSHAEGQNSEARQNNSHAEGQSTIADGDASHAEGRESNASGAYSHAEGRQTTASNNNAHAEGQATVASGHTSHAEGWKCIAGTSDTAPVVNSSTTEGNYTHAEGNGTWALGNSSHAEGIGTKANGIGSHSEGNYTITNNNAEHASGQYNVSTKSSDVSQATQFSIGIGTSDTDRKNAFEVKRNGDIYIEGIEGRIQDKLLNIDLLVPIEYADIKSLRDNSQLIPGKQYRITDYETTTTQENTQSVGHLFDVIVLALSENSLADEAYAIQSVRDTDGYFANSNLGAWKLWYCLDNSTERFAWADADNGKGVIYYMKDEYNNECPYDFKNIQFVRKLNPSTYCYTFGKDTDYSMNGLNYGNVIKEYKNDNKIRLNDIVFLGDDCYSNTFGNDCYSNTFGNDCYSNTFGNNCYSNTFGNDCRVNTFGNDCYSNTFDDYCEHNTLGNNCRYNTFDILCDNNSFGNSCNSNSFGNSCDYNSFGNFCRYNTFSSSCEYNSFGNNCEYNSFGNSCDSNSFGNNCYSNTFGNSCNYNSFGESRNNPKSYYRYIIFDNGNSYIKLNCTSTISSTKYYQNVRIGLGVNNTSTYKTINDSNVGQTYETCYKPANSQTITV